MNNSNSKKYTCLFLAGRNHGLETLKNLKEISDYNIIAIFTHKFNPKSLDTQQKERDDFSDYEKFAEINSIPLYTIDKSNEKFILDDFALQYNYDFLISISWRFLISPQVFSKSNIGSINLHRGDLPKYAGVEPIKRALENSEKFIHISCHNISKHFDEGEVIFESTHPTNYDVSLSLDDNVERLKKEITPYFPQLTIKSLEFLIGSKYHGK
jgi:methionyl-tRNA formyltransferase